MEFFHDLGYGRTEIGVWRSLVARLFWVQEAGGSNPLTPTHALVAQPDQSVGLLSRMSQVRFLPGAPVVPCST